MAPPAIIIPLLANTWFRTFISGAGFFADSYDLFVTDGVTNILKNLGPVNVVNYNYYDSVGNYQRTTLYFNSLCDTSVNEGLHCIPVVYSNTTAGFIPRTGTTYTEEMLPRYQAQTTDLKNGVNNAALIASILGQLFFGFAGDLLGRKVNFFLTSLLIILGCLGSATASAGYTVDNCKAIVLGSTFTGFGSNNCLPNGSYNNVYFQLYFWRFILGFGVGGEYPLASTITSESSTKYTRGKAVLSIFSMQGFGKLTASIVNYAVIAQLKEYGGPWEFDATWRFALAMGCLLNILTVYFRYHMEESDIFNKQNSAELQTVTVDTVNKGTTKDVPAAYLDSSGSISEDPLPAVATLDHDSRGTTTNTPTNSSSNGKAQTASSLTRFYTTLHLLWENKYLLIGTASTWFLMDVTFYGQSLMNTTVVNSAVASTTGLNSIGKLRQSLLSTIYVMLIALPGYWFAIGFVDKMGRYWMTQMGFLLSMVWFIVLSAGYNGVNGLGPSDSSAASIGFVIVYGLTYFFANFGPNSTTFLMANEGFATRIRSTAHGISAATGKLGASAGSFGLLAYFNSFCLSTPDTNGNAYCTVGKSTQSEIAKGVVSVMAVCAGICFAGNIMTTFFLKETGNKELHEVDADSEVLKERLRIERKEITGNESELPTVETNIAPKKPISGNEKRPLLPRR